MKLGQQFLVLRYGIKFVDDCIEKHIEVIQNEGTCWFGKIGTSPSKKVLENIMNADDPIVILYSRQGVFEGHLIEVSVDKPHGGYPKYYDEFLFERGTFPSMYFNFREIVKVNKDDLKKYTVVSSGNSLMETLNKSMSSFFWAEYKEAKCLEEKSDSSKAESKINELNENCKYIIEDKCSDKSCVNYGYICDKSYSCIKQRKPKNGKVGNR